MQRPRTPRAPWRNVAATASLAALALGSLWPSNATAHEPKKANEPRIMSEPGEVTNVIDAFDDDNNNSFDLHLTLGFQRSWMGAKILRETSIGGNNNPGLTTGRYTSSLMNVANYSEVTSRLNTRADLSVYKDIAIYLRMPIILANDRELTGLNGSDRQQGVVLQGSPTGGATGGPEQLFSLPFKSPTRSGIEYLATGFDLGIFNQARDPSKPTWIFGFEGRFNVSEPMHACGSTTGINQPGPQVDCADPSDINRNGRGGETTGAPGFPTNELTGSTLEGNFSGKRKPGVSRGTTAIEVHSLMSRRVKYVEPYGGFRALFEFANANSDYGPTRNLNAVLTSSPPLQGWMIAGMMFIPYENREQFQRLSFDLRFTGTYRSQGRDYTPIFDALGSSDAPSIRRPNFAEYEQGNTQVPNNLTPGTSSVIKPGSSKIYVTGLTDTAAHGSFTISGSAQFQAGEYVKFQIGGGYTYIQPHTITGDQPCNPNFSDNVNKSGPCQSLSSSGTTTTRGATGIPNPLYRPAVDIVGRRFLMSNANQVDLWAQAVVMF
jgi:hypothetical protein